MAVNPWLVTYFSPLRGGAASAVTTGMPLSCAMWSLYRTEPRVQRREALGGPHVAPGTPVQLATQPSRADRAIEERQQREAPGGAVMDELRAKHAHHRISEAVGVAAHDAAALAPEGAAHVVRRVGDQHQVGVRVGLELEAREIDVGPDVG